MTNSWNLNFRKNRLLLILNQVHGRWSINRVLAGEIFFHTFKSFFFHRRQHLWHYRAWAYSNHNTEAWALLNFWPERHDIWRLYDSVLIDVFDTYFSAALSSRYVTFVYNHLVGWKHAYISTGILSSFQHDKVTTHNLKWRNFNSITVISDDIVIQLICFLRCAVV